MGPHHVLNRAPKVATKPKSQVQDESIMGVNILLRFCTVDPVFLTSVQTNNSSIVSKRSVERLYFPNEPHFFRYFVKRPQRRSPLINRGYVCSLFLCSWSAF
jgi:tRNA wybutosine-synthesizing protein 4